MDIKKITAEFSVTAQIGIDDLAAVAEAGFKSVICNRPDGETTDQTAFSTLETSGKLLGLEMCWLAAESGKVTDLQAKAFGEQFAKLPKPVLAYCRTGMRSITMWALSPANRLPAAQLMDIASSVGFDLKPLASRFENAVRERITVRNLSHEVVIVGGGAAGIAVAASLLARRPGLDIAVIDPAETHFYQPGWTLVGGGIFKAASTARAQASLMPHGVKWIQAAVASFDPVNQAVVLEDGRTITYQQLVVCPGLRLDWDGVEGLSETLGRNGVTSNYRYDLAPYTWELVRNFRGGKALFTQPPMPIKCAGAPQKAMYLSADHWKRQGVLKDVDVQFCLAGAVLFGVADYVPSLMDYVNAYGIGLNFGETLMSIDGTHKTATFSKLGADGSKILVTRGFDMIHVVPPQKPPEFIRTSPLADSAGWVEVDANSLQHKKFANVFALGDAANTTNAKTAAAVRKQAPVVAHNLLALRGEAKGKALYDGYGSCPLTVERGKIVLAEFTYGGKVAPSFPNWLIDGTRPSKLAWLLKEHALPSIYWNAMLKGREWLARPEMAD